MATVTVFRMFFPNPWLLIDSEACGTCDGDENQLQMPSFRHIFTTHCLNSLSTPAGGAGVLEGGMLGRSQAAARRRPFFLNLQLSSQPSAPSVARSFVQPLPPPSPPRPRLAPAQVSCPPFGWPPIVGFLRWHQPLRVAIHPTWPFFDERAKVPTELEKRTKRRMTQAIHFSCYESKYFTLYRSIDSFGVCGIVLPVVAGDGPSTHSIVGITQQESRPRPGNHEHRHDCPL